MRSGHLTSVIQTPAREWVTLKKAEERTGLPSTFFDERTGASGVWPEGKVWKWFEGRKLVDLEAFYALVDETPSVASNRGRRRSPASNETCHEHQAVRQG
jgi:hypothetical protein